MVVREIKSTDGFQGIAWGFFKPLGSNGRVNTEKTVLLSSRAARSVTSSPPPCWHSNLVGFFAITCVEDFPSFDLFSCLGVCLVAGSTAVVPISFMVRKEKCLSCAAGPLFWEQCRMLLVDEQRTCLHRVRETAFFICTILDHDWIDSRVEIPPHVWNSPFLWFSLPLRCCGGLSCCTCCLCCTPDVVSGKDARTPEVIYPSGLRVEDRYRVPSWASCDFSNENVSTFPCCRSWHCTPTKLSVCPFKGPCGFEYKEWCAVLPLEQRRPGHLGFNCFLCVSFGVFPHPGSPGEEERGWAPVPQCVGS